MRRSPIATPHPPSSCAKAIGREKVKSRTLANLTHWEPERIEALRRTLRGEFDGLEGRPQSGAIFGVLFALKQLAEQKKEALRLAA